MAHLKISAKTEKIFKKLLIFILIIYIILALIAFISPIPEISKNVNNGINNTNVVKILYENNLLVKIIENNIN